LGMSKTGIRSREQKVHLPDMSWGHLYVAEKETYVPADSFPEFNYAIWLGNRKGPGRVSASAADLLRWDRALYTEALVPDRTIQLAFSPAQLNDGSVSNYGFGWFLDRHEQHGRIVYHTGDNPGLNTIFIRYLDKKLTFIILCNNAHGDFGELVKELQAIVLVQ
ncbi:MAG TPA: serine hydrolase domain-containing protein, partial [Chryseosolibacter sp.]|nr:serine hydrolase domain-containing protein [Chryseosolibacter sp.]